MKIKNVAFGILLALANLGSVAAQADQPGLGDNGEFLTISAEASGFVNFFAHPSEVESIEENCRENLNRKAIEACADRRFIIDESSIQQTGSSEGRILTVRMTARVVCINSGI